MCDACRHDHPAGQHRRAELAALETALAMTELAVEVIRLEAEAGVSWSGASRPLHDHEIRASVRFGELDRIGAEATALIARHADGVRRAVIDALIADLRGIATAGDPFALLTRLQALSSPMTGASLPLREALDRAAGQITAALNGARSDAAAEVVAEAVRQGVPEALLHDAKTLAATPEERRALEALARQVAEAPLLRLLDVASKEARAGVTPRTDPHALVDAIATSLDAVSPAGVEDLARQATTRAVNAGREAAAREAPEPEEVYASELLDKATCARCAEVDGRMYASLDDALVDYPSGGSYRDCLGGARCRGTLVFVWATEAAPTLDHPGDQPLPVHVIDRTPYDPATGFPAVPEAPGEVPGVPAAVLAQFDRLAGPEPLEQAVKVTNPQFFTSKQYQVNCQRVIHAYELRRRGVDVVAKPNPGDGAGNVSVYGTWLDGLYQRVLAHSPMVFPSNWRRLKRYADYKGLTIDQINDELTANGVARRVTDNPLEYVRAEVLSWPVGARGMVRFSRKSGAGHVFNVERTAEGVRFIDAQPGELDSAAVEAYFAEVAESHHASSGQMRNTLSVARMDDLTYNDGVLRAVEKPGQSGKKGASGGGAA